MTDVELTHFFIPLPTTRREEDDSLALDRQYWERVNQVSRQAAEGRAGKPTFNYSDYLLREMAVLAVSARERL